MKITIQRLRLQNFKGITSYEMVPNGLSMSVFGPNGSGKSTIADGLNWLLFNKNQAGDASFSVKTLDGDGQEIHNLEHSVEAVLGIEQILDRTSGHEWNRRVTLRKVMTEKWTKKRGTQTQEFTGHETVYYIDEVPKKEKEYKEFISGMIREDLFRLLTSSTYFNQQMKWQDRRKMLLEVAGNITDAAVIASDEQFAELPSLMGTRTFDDTMKMFRSQRPKINEELERVPVRIAEAELGKPGDAACMPPQGSSYANLTAKLQNLQTGRAAVLAGDTSEIQQQITAKKAEIEDAALKHRKAIFAAEDYRRKINDEALTYRRGMEAIDSTCARLEQERTRLENENNQLRTDFGCVTKVESICASCPLWQEADDSSRATAPGDQAANVEMAEKKKSIQAKGKANKARIEQINETIKENHAEWDSLKQKKEDLEAQAAAVKDPEGPNMTSLQAELASLTLKLTSVGTPDTEAFDAEIEQVKAAIRLHDEAAAASKLAGQIEQRVTELKASQKQLGKEIDELDRKIMLCESFIRAKVSMLESSVAAKFAPLSFRLFNDQINGGLQETCETLVPSPTGAMVPYSDANTGARIFAGLKIIDVLGSHFGISAPVFIDNAESLTTGLPHMDSQTISLVALDDGKRDGLRVVVRELSETF